MKRALFFVEQGSCYLEIIKIWSRNDKGIKATVHWYSKPGRTFLCKERIFIPDEAKKHWQRIIV